MYPEADRWNVHFEVEPRSQLLVLSLFPLDCQFQIWCKEKNLISRMQKGWKTSRSVVWDCEDPCCITYNRGSLIAVVFGFTMAANDSLCTIVVIEFLGLSRLVSGLGFCLFCQGIASIFGPPFIGKFLLSSFLLAEHSLHRRDVMLIVRQCCKYSIVVLVVAYVNIYCACSSKVSAQAWDGKKLAESS